MFCKPLTPEHVATLDHLRYRDMYPVMREHLGKSYVPYNRGSYHYDDSDEQHPLATAFYLVLLLVSVISLLAIVYTNDGKQGIPSKTKPHEFRNKSDDKPNTKLIRREILIFKAKAGEAIKIAVKKRAKTTRTLRAKRRMRKLKSKDSKVAWPKPLAVSDPLSARNDLEDTDQYDRSGENGLESDTDANPERNSQSTTMSGSAIFTAKPDTETQPDRKRKSTSLAKFPDLVVESNNATDEGKAQADGPTVPPDDSDMDVKTLFTSQSETESEQKHGRLQLSRLQPASESSASVTHTERAVLPEAVTVLPSRKPVDMSITIPTRNSSTNSDEIPQTRLDEGNQRVKQLPRGILEMLGYPPEIETPRTPGTPSTPSTSHSRRRSNAARSNSATPRIPLKPGRRKPSLMMPDIWGSSPISPKTVPNSVLPWTARRMRSLSDDRPVTPDEVRQARESELWKGIGRRPSLLFPIPENPARISQTAPSTPQKSTPAISRRDLEPPGTPSRAWQTAMRPTKPNRGSTYHGRGQPPVFGTPDWDFMTEVIGSPNQQESNSK